ncbi:MAG: 2-dehydro-3-deoxy-D-gluconate 5-dehydrogenase KduD [Rubrobacter sp.]|nr:2-dehydro-3-deoxy-D-gluconate 5-dehydrogenase KduD [Rubrobacter sp.]
MEPRIERSASGAPFSLAGKTALVTGARTGIGQAVAAGLAEAGADLILLGHRDNMGQTEKLVASAGRSCTTVLADLSRPGEIDGTVEEVLDNHRVDILVNNAGTIARSPAVDYPREDWETVMDTNLNSMFFLTQRVGRPMLERGEGKVINIASLLAFQGGVNVPAYAASKHGVAGLTKALANEWAPRGIQVNAIAPGYIATNNTEALRQDPQRSAEILGRIPAGRWGSPEDLAGAAVFLASDAANYVNGHVLTVDGGWMAR